MNTPITIGLAGHQDPKLFLEQVTRCYPDSMVSLHLDGDQLKVTIDEQVPLQLRVSICDFLTERAREWQA